jgi:hypothetical protein
MLNSKMIQFSKINLLLGFLLSMMMVTMEVSSFGVGGVNKQKQKQHSTSSEMRNGGISKALLEPELSRRSLVQSVMLSSLIGLAAIATFPIQPANARLESVNRPDLLPKEPGLNVIQTEKLLTSGQAKRINDLLTNLEKDTGFRVRVLCQNYPNTPGLAIRDYWSLGKDDQKDDKYVVLVVDQFGGRGNALNFNVGDVSYYYYYYYLNLNLNLFRECCSAITVD